MKKLNTVCLALVLSTAGAVANSPQQSGQGDRFLDVIVSLNVDADSHPAADNRAVAAEVARDHGVRANRTFGTVFAGFSASVPEAALQGLKNDPVVDSISYDGTVSTFGGNCPHCGGNDDDDDGGDDDTNQEVPWGIDRVGSQNNPNTGAGISVYVLDTGIDASHDDLAANLGEGYAVEICEEGGGGPGGGPFAGGGNDDCQADWDDDQGHGTHVAGTIGAIDNDIDVVGVAPDVTLHAVKVLDSGGGGTFAGIIEGIDWVAEQAIAKGEAVVANMSLGGGGSKDGECTDSGFSGDDNMHRAICNAKNAGVVFVVAAGNDGADASGSVPAAYDDAVVTVSATEEGDDWTSWSNWGDDAAAWTSNDSAPVAIAAPGADVLSTAMGGGTESLSGTSMAAPHVAGGAALFLNSNLQSQDASAFHNTRAALLDTAENTDGFSNTSGNPHDEDFLDAGNL